MHPPKQSLSELLRNAPDPHMLWVVDVHQQEIHRHMGKNHWETASVSTSRFGLGSKPDSNKTPVGWHEVTDVIGKGGAIDQEYISREPVAPSNRDDRILSRILWLHGLEDGINHTSHDRYIYIHGTNQTAELGTPTSMGCIRMDPKTIATWADECGENLPLVWIGEVE